MCRTWMRNNINSKKLLLVRLPLIIRAFFYNVLLYSIIDRYACILCYLCYFLVKKWIVFTNSIVVIYFKTDMKTLLLLTNVIRIGSSIALVWRFNWINWLARYYNFRIYQIFLNRTPQSLSVVVHYIVSYSTIKQ